MTAGGATGARGRAPRAAPLSAARLAAVQALYQMDLAGTDVNDVVAEFAAHRFDPEGDEDGPRSVDPAFFSDILTGVVREQRRIDPLLAGHLAQGWRLARLDSTLRAILRSAAYEILHRPDVPARVVINEYVDVAHAFFEDEEPKVVNGILDRFARAMRAAEFGPAPNG